MKILFIGGTGNISVSVSKLAVAHGLDLYLLNRGRRQIEIAGVKTITADITQPAQVKAALDGQYFDAVVNWIAFRESDIERDLDLFREKTGKHPRRVFHHDRHCVRTILSMVKVRTAS